jgi:ketosteroid isomerase-like protein
MHLILIILGFCYPYFLMYGQVPDEDGHAADHAALRIVMKEVATALNERDVPGITRHLASPFVFTAMNQRVITSPAQMEKMMQELFVGPEAPLTDIHTEPEATVPTIFTSADTGYCYGTAKELYTLKDGGSMTMTTHWTASVVRQNGVWKASTIHLGLDPLDNPILRKAAKTTVMTLGFALLVGLVLGAFAMRLLSRAQPQATAGAGT